MPSSFIVATGFAVTLSLTVATFGASAQGFPGGGGHGGHGGGSHAPPAGPKPMNLPPAQQAADPLITFLGSLHALRVEILVSETEVPSWTAMQDALRAYAELVNGAAQDRNAAADAQIRLQNLAADARARADALQKVSDTVTAMVAALDDHQRPIFISRLGDALSGSPSNAH